MAAELKSLGSTDVNKAYQVDCCCAVISPAINVGVSIIAPRDYIAMVCRGVQILFRSPNSCTDIEANAVLTYLCHAANLCISHSLY